MSKPLTVLEELNNLIKDEDMIFYNYTKDKFGEITLIEEPKTTLEEKIENFKQHNIHIHF